MKTATLILAERFLFEYNISAAALAPMVGVSASGLRSALRGEVYLGSEKEARILETASRVAKFKEALEPLQVKEWADLEALLKSGRTPEEVRGLVDAIFRS